MKKTLLGMVCLAAVAVVAVWFFSPVADVGADDKKDDSSLLAKIPAGYTQKAYISVLEWELVKAAPILQSSTSDFSTAYLGYDLDIKNGRITLKFLALRAVWNRKGFTTMVKMMIKARFPDIEPDVWAFVVVNVHAKNNYKFTNGKWESKPWGLKKK